MASPIAMKRRVHASVWLLSAVTLLQLTGASAYPAYHELYYSQKLDHFNPESTTKWQHRYLLNNDTWDGRGKLPNGCHGPILLYTGNEGPIDAFWPENGFMVEVLAPEFGALLVFPEERYYGKSLPFGDASHEAPNLAYLTTSQILEDYAELIYHLKATLPSASNCPVVAFGGSYGATLTALLRASHPEAVIGGLAASSELGYYDVEGWAAHGVTPFTFEDIVVRDYTQARHDCLDSILRAEAAVNAADISEVTKTFGTCDVSALGPGAKSGLFKYALEALPQMDYPYAIGAMPAKPVTAACNWLTDAGNKSSDLIAAAARVTRMSLGIAEDACVPNQGPGGPGNTPGDGPGPSSWGWQSCTETLHAFSARIIRDYEFNLKNSTRLCARLYNGSVAPDLSALARSFGGYALAEGAVTHLIWSQGTLDPWHGWFNKMSNPQAGSEVYHFLMEGSAHHLDLKTPNSLDPPDVTAARSQDKEIIRRWIQEASAPAAAQPVLLL